MRWIPVSSLLTFLGTLAACSVAPTGPGAHSPDSTAGNATATASPAAPGREPAVTRLVCKSSKEERVLELRVKDDGCELLYVRGGSTRNIATSKIGDAHCRAVRGKTQSNLERSGYRCQ